MHTQTQRQREVLDFIIRYIESHGYRPSYQLIANRLGVRSRSGIARIVHDLESQGLLARRREDGHFHIDISMADTVIPVFWLDAPGVEETGETSPISLPQFMLGGYEAASVRTFRVNDDSLSAEHICEYDIALIELREFARDGQIIAVVIDKKETVLRKYYRAGADIELSTADDDEAPIRIPADRVEIKGIYQGVLRPMV